MTDQHETDEFGYDAPELPQLEAEPGDQLPELPESAYPDDATPLAPAADEPEYDPQLVAAVTAHQRVTCGDVVPEALAIRLQYASQIPDGQWRRTAGADDPEVMRLEAPYRLVPAPSDGVADDATGSRRRK